MSCLADASFQIAAKPGPLARAFACDRALYLYRDGRDVIPAMQQYWRRGFAGGALQVLSYGIAIWAMTVAPIAIVATLRETSVLFGAGIAVVVL